jgi:hypothetical protein
MTSPKSLLELLEKIPRDKKGGFVEGPELNAVFDALVRSKPLDPIALLAHAKTMRSDPKRGRVADYLLFQALSVIAHDPQFEVIKSKIGKEMTPWGVTVDQIYEKIVEAYKGFTVPHTRPIGGAGPEEGGNALGYRYTGRQFVPGRGGSSGGITVGDEGNSGGGVDDCLCNGIWYRNGKQKTYPLPPPFPFFAIVQCNDGQLTMFLSSTPFPDIF